MKIKSYTFFISCLLFFTLSAHAQTGLNFQGVARNTNNVILASQPISLRLSIIRTSVNGTTEYSETRKVTTNAQGLFAVVIGDTGAISSLGNFSNIDWKLGPKFLKIEMDVSAGNNFILLGTTQFQSVAYAQFANTVEAEKITGIVPVEKGGTGVNSLASLKAALSIDKNTIGLSNVNNTADTAKPISNATKVALDRKADTADLVLKAPLASPTFTGTVGGITKTMVGLSAVDNTSDLAKPISTATQTALDTKVSTETFSTTIATKENATNKSTATDLGGNTTSDILFPTQKAVKTYVDAQANSGGVADGGITNSKLAEAAVTNDKIASGIDKSKVGLGNVDNTADSLKPISIPVQAALDSKASSSELRSFVKIDTVNRFISEQLFDAGLTTASLTLGGGTRIESGINSETTLFNRSGADFIINTTAISGNDTPTSSSWIFKSDGTLSFDNLVSFKFDSIVEEFKLSSDKDIVIESYNEYLRLFANEDIELTADEDIELTADYDIELTAYEDIELTADYDIELTADDDIELTADENVLIKTGIFQFNDEISSLNEWRFGQDGILTFPDGSTLAKNYPYFELNTYENDGVKITTNNDPNQKTWIFNKSGVFILPKLRTAPSSGTLEDGAFAVANPSFWDPLTKGGTEAYPVFYNGNNWVEFGTGVGSGNSTPTSIAFIDPNNSTNYNTFTADELGAKLQFNLANTISKQWSYNSNGSLTFPDGTITSGSISGTTNFGFDTRASGNGFSLITAGTLSGTSQLWSYDTDGILTFPDGTITSGSISGTTNFGFDTRAAENGFSIVTAGTSSGTSQLWSYNTDGSLTFPDGTITSGSISGTANFGFDTRANGNGFSLITAGTLSGTSQQWSYNTDGSLTFPDGTITSGNIAGTANFGFDTRATDNGFSIVTAGFLSGSSNYWEFTKNGELIFPINGAIGYKEDSNEGNALQIITPESLKIISGNRVWNFNSNGDTYFPRKIYLQSGSDILKTDPINPNSEESFFNNIYHDQFIVSQFQEQNPTTIKFMLTKTPRSINSVSVYINGSRIRNEYYEISDLFYIKYKGLTNLRVSDLVQIDYQY